MGADGDRGHRRTLKAISAALITSYKHSTFRAAFLKPTLTQSHLGINKLGITWATDFPKMQTFSFILKSSFVSKFKKIYFTSRLDPTPPP